MMNIKEYQAIHEEKQHFGEILPYNTYPCSIPLDFTQVPLHWHDEAEFIYIKKGTGKITVDFAEYKVTANDIMLILPGSVHGIYQYQDEKMEYENIIFSPQLLDSTQDDFYINYLLPFFEGKLKIPQHFHSGITGYSIIKKYLDSNDNISAYRTGPWGLAIKGNLYLLFFSLLSLFDSKATIVNDKKINILKPVIKYIELHYNEKITVSDMAELSGFSESHFMRFFKENLGVSFITYLNDYRLSIAARLLLQKKDSVLAISEASGFDNLSYFNRVFKKKYKTTPREYRNQFYGRMK